RGPSKKVPPSRSLVGSGIGVNVRAPGGPLPIAAGAPLEEPHARRGGAVGAARGGPSLWSMGSDLDRSRRLVVPEMVARSARREPGAPALAFDGERRTFAALEERANRLAAALAA